MSHHPSVPPGSLLGGKFRIKRLLGAGAMGTVYAIDHELTRHERALKLLHPALQDVPDLVRRFLKEASAAGRAGDAHLVETFDAGRLPTGETYVVMELLEGETLGAILRRERVLGPALAAELVAQAAEGMAAAHGAGIIHRDLKPDNLFVTTRDGAPFIKIMDFGVSKFATGTSSGMRATRAGVLYGSPAYMSPEQILAEVAVDPRTDVFSLGVVLFECLTGATPFDGPTVEALVVAILRGEVALHRLDATLPAGLVGVVRGALAGRREERIPSTEALARALAPYRAVRAPAVDFAFAATVVAGTSAPPLVSRSPRASAARPTVPSPSGAAPPTPSSPPSPSLRGVALPGRGLGAVGVAIAAAALAGGVTVAARWHALVSTAVTPLSPSPPSTATPRATLAAPITREELVTAESSAPFTPPAVPPNHTVEQSGEHHPSAPSPSSTGSAASAGARASAAQDLGLRVDNPFR
jgi:serine/threonine-protein kinase